MNHAHHEHAQSDWLSVRRQIERSPKRPKAERQTTRDVSSLDVIGVSRGSKAMRCVVEENDPGELLRALQALGSVVKNALNRSVQAENSVSQAAPALSQAEFARLASEDPASLSRLLGPDARIPAPLLTFAAEAVALVRDPPQALLRACITLLDHEKAYVREGAVLGLAPHLEDAAVSDALRRVATSDPDEDVRDVAEEALDE